MNSRLVEQGLQVLVVEPNLLSEGWLMDAILHTSDEILQRPSQEARIA